MTRHTARRERLPKPVTLAPEPDQARRLIVKAIRRGREYTAGDLATITGMSEGQARRSAGILADMGLLKRGKIGIITVYRVADHA